jgi:hypothetical protein
MLEIYFDKRGELAIENLEDLMKAFPQDAERAAESALRSEGYRLKNLIRIAIKRGGPENDPWPELNPHTGVLSRAKVGLAKKSRIVKNYKMVWRGPKGKKKRVPQYKQVMLSKRRNPLSKMAGAVRYEYDEDLEMVSIGFLHTHASAQVLRLARMHARGYETPITPTMRKMLFGLGFPVKKSTTTLKTPARPVIEPIFEQEKDTILRNLEMKFIRNVLRYIDERHGRTTINSFKLD